MRISHYRNLKQIVNNGKYKPVMFSPDIIKISENKKFNHVTIQFYILYRITGNTIIVIVNIFIIGFVSS